MTDSDYKNITNDIRTFPGPRLFWVCGYAAPELQTLKEFLSTLGYTDVTVRYCTRTQRNGTLLASLTSDGGDEPPETVDVPHVMVFSGMTTTDLQKVMGRFSTCGLPRPIFATTTPTNLGFTVQTLIEHLVEEQTAAIGANRPTPK